MAGFLGLGGGSESYFLDSDDAKSMGDIEYMRKPIKVKRTFAKSKGWGDVGASEKSISAYSETGGDIAASTSTSYNYSTPTYTPTYTAPETVETPIATTPAPVAEPETVEAPVSETAAPAPAAPVAETAPAAPVSDGMDMFRAMARKIR